MNKKEKEAVQWLEYNPSRYWDDPKPFESRKEWVLAGKQIKKLQETLIHLYESHRSSVPDNHIFEALSCDIGTFDTIAFFYAGT